MGHPGRTRRALQAGLLAAAAALGGCAGVSRGPSAAPTPGAAPAAPALTPAQRAGLPTALAIERQWLLSWFKGSPVAITQRGDGAVTVEVPRRYCFEPGRSRIKPPLAAVLDKVAESLRRHPLVQLALAAPGDGPAHDAAGRSAEQALARDRAAQVQQYLREHGVAAERLAPPAVDAAGVRLRLEAPPA